MGIFETLHKSSWNLHKRFGNYPPDIGGQRYAFEEEVQEILHEAKEWEKGNSNKESLVEEALDVIVTLSGILLAAGVSLSEMQKQAELVTEKNDKKNAVTHIVDPKTKKIRRKTRKEVLEELNGKNYKVGYLLIETPKWVENTLPKPIQTKNGKFTLAMEMANCLKNDKYIACHAVFSNSLISSHQEYVHIDMPCIHDKQELLKVLQANNLAQKDHNNATPQMGDDIQS